MAKLVQDFWTVALEQPLASLNLLDNRAKRFAVVTAASGIIIYAIKPKGLFDKKGQPYAQKLPGVKRNEPSVMMNWLTLSSFIGVMSVLLV
jgi:hypothetical protein